jgi:hypothetical protein
MRTGEHNTEIIVANYPFEKSRRFAGIQPNFGHGDHSRLSCGVEEMQLGLGRGSQLIAEMAGIAAIFMPIQR